MLAAQNKIIIIYMYTDLRSIATSWGLRMDLFVQGHNFNDRTAATFSYHVAIHWTSINLHSLKCTIPPAKMLWNPIISFRMLSFQVLFSPLKVFLESHGAPAHRAWHHRKRADTKQVFHQDLVVHQFALAFQTSMEAPWSVFWLGNGGWNDVGQMAGFC